LQNGGLEGFEIGGLFDYNVSSQKRKVATMANSESVDLLKAAGALGGISLVAVFLNAAASTLYARGLLSHVGFSASTYDAISASHMFGIITDQRSMEFVIMAAFGFVILPFLLHTGRITGQWFPSIWLLLLLGELGVACVMQIHSQSPYLRIPIGAVAFICPALIGVGYNSTENTPLRFTFMIVSFVIALGIFGKNIEAIGDGEGDVARASTIDQPWAVLDLGIKGESRDFPVITLVTKEGIGFLEGGIKTNDGYLYSPQKERFLRLIAHDDSQYFIIEKTNSVVSAITLRRDAVIAMKLANPKNAISKAP